MSSTDLKLRQLKNCLGIKKLKQLGLLICSTCNELDIHNATIDATSDISELSSELALSTPIQSEEDLLKHLLSILYHSKRQDTDSLDMGYTYNVQPPQSPDSFSCSECGKQYAFDHIASQLIALPIFLTDTEYEMIKGVYVDILL